LEKKINKKTIAELGQIDKRACQEKNGHQSEGQIRDEMNAKNHNQTLYDKNQNQYSRKKEKNQIGYRIVCLGGGGCCSKTIEPEKEVEMEKEQNEEYIIDMKDIIFEKEIGKGAFGEVWKGKYKRENIDSKENEIVEVAIKKIILKEKSGIEMATMKKKTCIEEFKEEIKLVTKFGHPNVTTIYGFTEKPENCIVMELLSYPLSKILYDQTKKLEWEERYKLCMGITAGVMYLHSRDIIHRDLKPDNVLIDEEKKIPKIADFGTSGRVAEISKENVAGTLKYMPPEVLEAFKDENSPYEPNKKSDIYALGMIL
jgi:tRNA A-37 threonylcarbamoyl transferase component Bud32